MYYSVIFCNTKNKKLFSSQSQHFPFRDRPSLYDHKLVIKIAVSFANTSRQKVFAACLQAAKKILSRHIFFFSILVCSTLLPVKQTGKGFFSDTPAPFVALAKVFKPEKIRI